MLASEADMSMKQFQQAEDDMLYTNTDDVAVLLDDEKDERTTERSSRPSGL